MDTDNKPSDSAEGNKDKNAPGTTVKKQKEIGGREGPDPVRYGDWENNGIASDF